MAPCIALWQVWMVRCVNDITLHDQTLTWASRIGTYRLHLVPPFRSSFTYPLSPLLPRLNKPGFNGGSALSANLRAAQACIVTNLAASVGGLTWMIWVCISLVWH